MQTIQALRPKWTRVLRISSSKYSIKANITFSSPIHVHVFLLFYHQSHSDFYRFVLEISASLNRLCFKLHTAIIDKCDVPCNLQKAPFHTVQLIAMPMILFYVPIETIRKHCLRPIDMMRVLVVVKRHIGTQVSSRQTAPLHIRTKTQMDAKNIPWDCLH